MKNKDNDERQDKVYEFLSKNFFPFLIPLVVAIIGYFATTAYKESEIAIARVEIVKDFMDRFESKNEYSKEASILSIYALGNVKLAINLASLYQTSGTISALAIIASNSKNKTAYFALEEMAKLLTHEDPYIRNHASISLSKINNPILLSTLINLSKDSNYINRYTAAKVLSNYPMSESIKTLNNILSNDDSKLVKDAAKVSLAKIKAKINNL